MSILMNEAIDCHICVTHAPTCIATRVRLTPIWQRQLYEYQNNEMSSAERPTHCANVGAEQGEHLVEHNIVLVQFVVA